MKLPQKVIQIGDLPPILEEGLVEHFTTHKFSNPQEASDFIDKHGSEIDALVARSVFGADAALMDRLPNIKIIGNFGVGYDQVDLRAAAERDIVVTNTPDVLTECVADLAFGLLISIARQIGTSDRFVRRKAWPGQPVYPLTSSVHKKKLGIVGLGRIGQAIAARGAGFGMEMRYHNRNPIPGLEQAYEASLPGLAEWADYLVVAVVGGSGTDKLINAEVLKALGPSGYLINIARGSVVDEPALVRALVNGQIAGAGLDVFVNEPQVPDELLDLDNVVLTPHMASGTHETRAAMGDLVLQNLLSFFKTGKALTLVGLA